MSTFRDRRWFVLAAVCAAACLAPKAPAAPVCVNCGSQNTELINWNDKVTGEAKQAWKCQDCKQWLPNAKKA